MDFTQFPNLFRALYPVCAEVVLARNVENVDEIERYTQKLADSSKVNDARIAEWLTRNLRNWLISDSEDVTQIRTPYTDAPEWLKKAIERGDKVYNVHLPRALRTKIDHVIDYLLSDQAPDRLDRLTVPEAMKQADAWTKKLTKKKTDERVAAEGEKILKTYPDGYTWRDLISKEALQREGTLMGHCVGGYCEYVEKGDAQILSLRDGKNEPHCTIEVDPGDKRIRQIKGKGNKAVVTEYQPYVRDLLKTEFSKYEVEPGELANIGMFMIDGELRDIEDIKKNPKLSGELVKKVFYNHMKEINKITTQDDGIRLYAYPEKMIDMLGISINRKTLDELKGTIEGENELWFEVDIANEDVSDLYPALEKKHPKTYKKMIRDFKRVAKKAGEDPEAEPWERHSGDWLSEHQDELEPIYQAAFDAIRDGWEVGTRDAGFRYVKNLLTNLEWDNGAKIEESDEDDGNQLYWFIPFQSLVDEDLGYSNEDQLFNRREGYESEFNQDVAKEYFYERLSEQGYTVD